MEIRVDDLTGVEIVALLQEHLRCMAAVSPPESRHALNLDGLRQPGITFWTIWSGGDLAGCGALKELDNQHGEIKSMRTAHAHQREGVASQMLRHIVAEAEAPRLSAAEFGDRGDGLFRAGAEALREFWFRALRAVWELRAGSQ